MAEHTVTSAADDGTPGTLRYVINTQAGSGDTVKFANTISTITLIQGEIVLSKNLTISGPGENVLTISGNNAQRAFTILQGITVIIEGLSIRYGRADNGGAIYNNGVLNLTNALLSHNNAYGFSGGAIYNNGMLNLRSSTLANNTAAASGGAIHNVRDIMMENSTLTNNSANRAGAIYTQTGMFEIVNCDLFGNVSGNGNGGAIYIENEIIGHIYKCVLANNRATDRGGAIYSAKSVTIVQCILSQNSAGAGGAIGAADDSIVYILDSTLAGNTASYVGGAIDCGGISGSLTIRNSTLSGNTADIGGAVNTLTTVDIINSTLSNNTAVARGGAVNNQHIANISFSTIAENAAPNGAGIYNTEKVTSKNSIFANRGGANFSGNNQFIVQGVNFSTDNSISGTIVSVAQLKLGPLALNAPGMTETHALLPGSVAIDAVTDLTDITGSVVITDQRGISRPQNMAGDAGAYEAIMLNRGIPFILEER